MAPYSSALITKQLRLLFRVTQGTVLAILHGTGSGERNVLGRMTQGAAAAVTNRHFSLHFNGRDLVDQVNGVGTVLAKFVLRRGAQERRRRAGVPHGEMSVCVCVE